MQSRMGNWRQPGLIKVLVFSITIDHRQKKSPIEVRDLSGTPPKNDQTDREIILHLWVYSISTGSPGTEPSHQV